MSRVRPVVFGERFGTLSSVARNVVSTGAGRPRS
ncbi:hypothetical protein EDF46_2375 [Frondihabitans sp. PhB188]|nr:hypothetical protein EDF46_2375 [Frondihabitans sp. PhB188]